MLRKRCTARPYSRGVRGISLSRRVNGLCAQIQFRKAPLASNKVFAVAVLPPSHGIDACMEHALGDWLGQKVIGTPYSFEHGDNVVFLTADCQEYYGGVVLARLAQPGQEFGTMYVWHHPVQQVQVETLLLGGFLKRVAEFE